MGKKKVINEELELEELKSLLMGKTIDFLDLEECNTKIKINGKNFEGAGVFKFFVEVLNMSFKRTELMFDILERYDNEEYWDRDIIDNEDYDEEIECCWNEEEKEFYEVKRIDVDEYKCSNCGKEITYKEAEQIAEEHTKIDELAKKYSGRNRKVTLSLDVIEQMFCEEEGILSKFTEVTPDTIMEWLEEKEYLEDDK